MQSKFLRANTISVTVNIKVHVLYSIDIEMLEHLDCVIIHATRDETDRHASVMLLNQVIRLHTSHVPSCS